MKINIILACIILIMIGFTRCKKENAKVPEKEKKALVITIAGSGTAGYLDTTIALAKFYQPRDIAVDNNGNVYVTDLLNNRIRKITTGGRVITYAGNGVSKLVNGPGLSASFITTLMIAFDEAGNLYVTDGNDPRLRKIAVNADVSTFAGAATPGFADGPVATAQFEPAWGIVADGQGNIIVADSYNHRIRKISAAGQVTTLAGSGKQGFADSTALLAKFDTPLGITLDKQGNLYVADYHNYRIRKITPGGTVSTLAGNGAIGRKDGKGKEAQFREPKDLAVDNSGNLFVSDLHCIRKITPDGMVTTIAGSDTPGYADGVGDSARFFLPHGIAADAAGNIYVADVFNNRIRKITFE